MSTAAKKSSPGLGQTILDWINPFSSKVPGDPYGGNVAAIPSQAAHQFEDITQPFADAANLTTSITKLFGNLGFWKGLGLVLAGALIILVVGIQLVRG